MQLTKEQVLELVQKTQWNVQGFNAGALYLHCAATRTGWMVAKDFGAGYTHFFYLFSDKRARMHYDEADWQRVGEAYFKHVTDRASLDALIAKYTAEFAAVVASHPVPEDLSSFDFAELVEIAQGAAERLIYSVGIAHAIEGITYVSEHRLRAILEAKGGFDEMTFSKLCSPTHASFLSEVRKELWAIKNAAPEDKRALAEAFWKQWNWVENTYQGQADFTIETVLKRAGEVVSAPDAHEFDQIAAEKERIMTERGFSAEERFVVESIDVSFGWQDDRKKNILTSIGIFDPVIRRLAEEMGIDAGALTFVLPEELTYELLSSADFKQELEERRKGSANYVTPEGTATYTGDDFTFFTDALHVEFGNGIKEFKGVSASRGVVTGTARVCESVSDIARVQEGEILVASMTRPEYLPAMQKAAAFVTDEGGITCHAAIVAREMKKPCVIGTKIATRAIKNGDTVEVNADAGVVKIIERAA